MAIDPNMTAEQFQWRSNYLNTNLEIAQVQRVNRCNELNDMGMKDANNNLLKFDTLEEWQAALNKGGIKPGPNMTAQNVTDLAKSVNSFFVSMQQAKDALNTPEFKAALEAFGPLEALRKMLESGDIEGAVMLLQTTRAKGLEAQLGTEVKAMQARNAQITLLNTKLNEEQEKLGKIPSENKKENNDARAAQQKVVSDIKTQIDSLNSESQVNMIRVQGLVNKRNEAFDMLTNLLGKFQKTIDGIVGNMR